MDGEKAENGRFGDEEGNVVVGEADEHVEKTDQHEKHDEDNVGLGSQG